VELIEHLAANAGSTVELTYAHDGQEGLTCDFEVPPSIRTVLGLPAHAQILAIDGQESLSVEVDSRPRRFAVVDPFGLREMLKRKVGSTVEVTYAQMPIAEAMTARLTVTEDMVDPWLGRTLYRVDVAPDQQTKVIKKGPLGAIKLGIKKTFYFIVSVYSTIERLVISRSVGVENLSGPVGIVKIGRSVAQVGLVELMFFLAMISANLAVLNFLPLPIVDGGLAVFLIIEKIKGSPVNLKIQMATQVIGLILIGGLFVFVTIQDLTK
jgi:regulator of sigma E protease